MSIFPRLAPVLLLVCFAACSTTPKRPPYLAVLQEKGVDSATYTKIYNHRVLNFDDIMNLVGAKVPGKEIVAYLRSTRAPYNLTQAQINLLVRAGADSTLVNYLGKSRGDFLIDAENEGRQERMVKDHENWQKFWDHPYYTDPYYLGAAPFDYGYPADWFYPLEGAFFGAP